MRCSTPFGITEVGTQRRRPGRPSGQVLNAFRHHRGRHTDNHDETGREAEVLNAFRHHRGRHATIQCKTETGIVCSTPFGITEVGTKADVMSVNDEEAGIVCSTPFGITEVGTLVHRHAEDRPGVCSTPFGITEVGTTDILVLTDGAVRCSTPFGITEVGTIMTDRVTVGSPGAQRLSASQRSAPCAAGRNQQAALVLNAFRHHRGRHTQSRSMLNDHTCAQRLSASQRSAR